MNPETPFNPYRYPTKEEIMECKITFEQEIIDKVMQWKYAHYEGQWKNTDKRIKGGRLSILVKSLTDNKVSCMFGGKYCYSPMSRTIIIERNHPSIISVLHEAAHHFFGPSELIACAWSIKLFMLCFPKAVHKLKWNKHMLCQR